MLKIDKIKLMSLSRLVNTKQTLLHFLLCVILALDSINFKGKFAERKNKGKFGNFVKIIKTQFGL